MWVKVSCIKSDSVSVITVAVRMIVHHAVKQSHVGLVRGSMLVIAADDNEAVIDAMTSQLQQQP